MPRPLDEIAADMARVLAVLANKAQRFQVVTNEQIAGARALVAEHEAAVKAIEKTRAALGTSFTRLGK